MSSSLFHKDLLVVPPEATFGPQGHTDDFILSHRLKKIFPENTATVKENSSIRFHLYGAGQHLDMRSVRLFFTAKMDTTVPLDSSVTTAAKEHKSKLGVAPIRFNDWIGSLFRTVEIRLNNQTLISRIDYRNVLHHIIGLYTVNEDWRRSVSGQNEGYFNSLCYRNTCGDLVPTNAWQKTMLSRTPTQYCIEFDLENIFKTQKYIPMDLVRSIDIELTTEYNHRAICRDHTNIGYGLQSGTLRGKNALTPFFKFGHGHILRTASSITTDGGFVGANLKLSSSSAIEMKNFSTATDLQLATEVKLQNTSDGWYGTQIGAGYSIDNYYITADFYQFNDAYRATLEQSLMEKGITFNMHGFINVTESLPTATRHEIRIRRSLTSVKSLYMSFELDSMIRNGLIEASSGLPHKYYADALCKFNRFGLKSYQVLLNGVPIQGHRIDTKYGDGSPGGEIVNAEHILETLKAFSTHGNHLLTGLEQAANKYHVPSIVPGDLTISQNDVQHGTNTLTGTATVGGTEGTCSISTGPGLLTGNVGKSLAKICSGDYMKDGVYYTNSDFRQSGVADAPFIIGVNLEKSTQVSGSSMQELVVLLDWEETTPAGLMVHSFLNYDQHLEIRPGFDFIVHE